MNLQDELKKFDQYLEEGNKYKFREHLLFVCKNFNSEEELIQINEYTDKVLKSFIKRTKITIEELNRQLQLGWLDDRVH